MVDSFDMNADNIPEPRGPGNAPAGQECEEFDIRLLSSQKRNIELAAIWRGMSPSEYVLGIIEDTVNKDIDVMLNELDADTVIHGQSAGED